MLLYVDVNAPVGGDDYSYDDDEASATSVVVGMFLHCWLFLVMMMWVLLLQTQIHQLQPNSQPALFRERERENFCLNICRTQLTIIENPSLSWFKQK